MKEKAISEKKNEYELETMGLKIFLENLFLNLHF